MSELIERCAGGIVVRSGPNGWEVLVIRDPYKNWGLPKGHLEGTESAEQAALREVMEETGLHAKQVGPEVATVDWFFRRDEARVHKFCTFYLMHAPEGEPRPQTDEGIGACEFLPFEQAVARVTYSNTREVVRSCAPLLEALEW